jgi:hypothetical protein
VLPNEHAAELGEPVRAVLELAQDLLALLDRQRERRAAALEGAIPLPPALSDSPEANLRARAFALAEGRVWPGVSSRFFERVEPTSVKEGDRRHSPPRAPAFLGLHLRRVRSSFAPGPAPSLPFCNQIVEQHSWSVKDCAA